MMGMGGSDDFYTQMLYAQMMNGGSANGGAPANWSNAGGNSSSNSQATSGKKFSWGNTALWGAGAAGATYAGMNWLNHDFNSPVHEVDGKIKFTDDFMRSFSGEYAAMKNEDALKKFYEKLSAAGKDKFKFTVKAENYDDIMEELKNFLAEDPSNRKLADMSDNLKGFLKAKLEKSTVTSGVTIDDTNRHLFELVESDLSDSRINKAYGDALAESTEIGFKHNYNLQRELYESFDDLAKGFAECADDAAKIEYLKNNPNFAYTLANNTDDLARVLRSDTTVLTNLRTTDAAKTGLKGSMESVENAMQSFAKKWNGKAGFFGKGNFKVFNKKTASVLDDALSAMRAEASDMSSWLLMGLPGVALIAGLAAAGATVLFNA